MSGWGYAVAAAVSYMEGREANRQRKYDREVYERFADRQLRLAEEQWSIYKDQILPLELEAQRQGISARDLALQRGERDLQLYMDFYAPAQEQMVQMAMDGIDPQYYRVTRDAAADVDAAYERQADVEARQNQRMGLRPDSGRAKGYQRTRNLSHAANRGFAINRAREAERNRVEQVGFNRLASALGRQPLANAPSQGAYTPGVTPGVAGSSFGRAGAAFGNLWADSSRRASQANQATGYWAARAYQGFKGGNQQNYYTGGGRGYGAAANDGGYGTISGQQNGTYEYTPSDSADGGFYEGGEYYNDGGLVEGTPGVDQIPATIDGKPGARLSNGEYVIPADVVQKKGQEFFDRLLNKYHEGPTPASKGLTRRGKYNGA